MMPHQIEIGWWKGGILIGRQGDLEGNVGKQIQEVGVVGSQARRVVQVGDRADQCGSRCRCRVGTCIVLERTVNYLDI